MHKITGMLTPLGLKIRLDGDFCEKLPLNDNKTVNDLLKDTESFICTGKWLVFIVGIFSFFDRIPNNILFIESFTIITITSLSFWIHPLFMFVRGALTISLPRIFVIINGWFIDKIALVIIGFLTVGWVGLLYYAGGYIIATFLGYILNIFLAKSNYLQFGVDIQSDENAFIFLSLRHLKKISFMDWIKSYYNYLNSEEEV